MKIFKFTVFLCAIVLLFSVAGTVQASVMYEFELPNDVGTWREIYWPSGWKVSGADRPTGDYNGLWKAAGFTQTEFYPGATNTGIHYEALYTGGKIGIDLTDWGYGMAHVKDAVMWVEGVVDPDFEEGASISGEVAIWGLIEGTPYSLDITAVFRKAQDKYFGEDKDLDGQKDILGYTGSINRIRGIVTRVPEPATMLLLGLSLIGLAGISRKKFKK